MRGVRRAGMLLALALAACAADAPLPTRRVEIASRGLPTPIASATPIASMAAIATTREAPAAFVAPAPRLTSVGYFTWIYGRPTVDDRFIGYVRFGRSVALQSTALVKGLACSGGFYAIEPRGYVCKDHTVTLAPSSRFDAEAGAIAPADGALPYRYALSNGAPMYARLPNAKEQKRAEAILGKAGVWIHLPRALAAHEELARAEAIAANDDPPAFTLDGAPLLPERFDVVHETMPLGSMLSFTRAFESSGRTWLLASDLTLVPADRVRPFKPSTFHGTRLGEGFATLPIAWFKTFSRPKVKIVGGVATKIGEWPARAFAELTGRAEEIDGERYLETKETDAGSTLFVSTRDATVIERADKLPYLVKPGEKWIVVQLGAGTLVAYDGLTPVYATLVSPGKGGIPVQGQDPVQAGTTVLGAYRITFKDRAATMSPDKKGEPRTLVIADVPFTQYFAPPFALHAAYWHDRFGEPTSAGCVNLAPTDAEYLFGFTEPHVPDGWAGATGAGAPENGHASWIVIRR